MKQCPARRCERWSTARRCGQGWLLTFSAFVFPPLWNVFIRSSKKTPIGNDRCLKTVGTHRSSFSTLRIGRLLYGQRACPSRTLYRRCLSYRMQSRMSRGNHGDKEFCKITGIKSSAHPGLTGNGACRIFSEICTNFALKFCADCCLRGKSFGKRSG